jgi:hypothetical protein
MRQGNEGYTIATKRKYTAQDLQELMQSSLKEKYEIIYTGKDYSRGDFWQGEGQQTIYIQGVDDYINLVVSGGKSIHITQVKEKDVRVKGKVTVASVASGLAKFVAEEAAGKILKATINAVGPEIRAVTGVVGGAVGGIVNTVGAVGRIAKYSSETKKREALEGNWGVLDELAKDIEKLVEVKTGGCYIATSIYGSYDCPEVWTLRRYRDTTLSASWLGRQVIPIYYTVSPKVVELFGNRKWFNRFWKPLLNRFVRELQKSGIDSSSYSD